MMRKRWKMIDSQSTYQLARVFSDCWTSFFFFVFFILLNSNPPSRATRNNTYVTKCRRNGKLCFIRDSLTLYFHFFFFHFLFICSFINFFFLNLQYLLSLLFFPLNFLISDVIMSAKWYQFFLFEKYYCKIEKKKKQSL